MVDFLAYPIIAASLAYAAWALIAVIRGQNPREPYVLGAGAVELLLLVQAVVAAVIMVVDDGPADTALFISYLIFTLILLPVALFWALAEKNRWGTSVLVFAAVVVAVLVVRLQQIWEGVSGG